MLSPTILPWNDRTGLFSPLKAIVLAALFVPAVWLLVRYAGGMLGTKPLTAAIRDSGDWALRFLLASLVITPARRLFDWPRLIVVRRMLGVAAFAYAALHLTLYCAEQNWIVATVVTEIARRPYLTIGAVAVFGLLLLALTSTDAMVRRLGVIWNRLHRLTYPLAVLGIVHFFLQSRLDVSEPSWMAGLFLLLMAYRLAPRTMGRITPLTAVVLAVLAAALTAGVEAAWYGLATGVRAARVFAANFDGSSLRPAAIVGLVGLGAAALAAVRQRRWR